MNNLIRIQALTEDELADLAYAKSLLENPGLAARLANLMGSPIEKGFKLLPKGWVATVQKASHAALSKALHVAVLTIDRKSRPRAANLMHKILAGASGGIGGAFGLAALPLELPISTTIMLRSIADIARSEGHELDSWDTRISCLEVFALGGRSPQDDAAENAYWIIRATLAKAVSEAAAYLAQRGVVEEGAPAIMRLIALIASRFGVVVSEQVAAKAVPVVGAAAGSVINVLFIDHFQNMARGHFIVKRLEARYGTPTVRNIYDSIRVRIRP
ncbi:MAG: EcsC family protein [Verrucomicrobiota bacterium]